MLEGAEPLPSAKTHAGRAAKWVGGVAVLAAVALALWHLVQFFREGTWPSYPSAQMLADLGIRIPEIPWPGLQHGIDWLLSWSAAGVLACFGIVLAFIGGLLTDSYDTRMEAAAAARWELGPASAEEQAASWARGGEREPGEEETEDEDEETATPAAPKGFGDALISGMTSLGCIVLVLACGLGLFIGWDYFDRTRYNRVAAHVHSVETSCLLEWEPPRDPAWWESSTPRRSAEMPCAEARPQARGINPRLVELKTVTYSYRSPADGRIYPGRLHGESTDFPPDVRPGGEMIAYALKADPSRSRGLYQWPVD
jgi:hypothetical protein